jgi:hypothetical protein
MMDLQGMMVQIVKLMDARKLNCIAKKLLVEFRLLGGMVLRSVHAFLGIM